MALMSHYDASDIALMLANNVQPDPMRLLETILWLMETTPRIPRTRLHDEFCPRFQDYDHRALYCSCGRDEKE